MVLSPPQGNTSTGETPMFGGNLIPSHVEREVGEAAGMVRSPRSFPGGEPVFGSRHGFNAGASDNMEEMKVRIGETRENNEAQESQRTDFLPLRTDEPKHDKEQTEPLSSERDKVMMANSSCRDEDLSLLNDKQCKNKMTTDGLAIVPPLGKLESSDENDLQLLISKDARGKSEASPTNSRTCLDRRKRKGKAYSDENVDEWTSKDEDGSHESIESCNSTRPTGLLSTGKKQWSCFGQQLTVGNKRVKKQVHEGPASTSFIAQDSSFVNWISNMVKGLNKTNHDRAPSLTLTLAHPSHGHDNQDQKLITFSRNDPKRNMGFQTIFQSLYCSNQSDQEAKMTVGNSPIAGSKELVLGNQVSDAAMEMCKSTSSCSNQNKTSANLACSGMKDRRNSSTPSLLGKLKADASGNTESGPPGEAKLTDNVGYICGPPRSLWITRFSPKAPGPVSNLDHGNQNTSDALECSDDCANLIPHTHNLIDQKSSEVKEISTDALVNVTGKELQNLAPNTEASFDQNSTYKLSPTLLSPKFTNSEAIASVFARRLNALKHIIPTDVEDSKNQKMTSCFYCGISGHDLRDCSEITEIERENFMRNISLYDVAEETPCLCIRCFQLDHWAILCPTASITTQHRSETKQSHSQVADAHNNCDGKKSQVDIGKDIAPSYGDNILKEKKITPLCILVNEKFSDVPKGIFDGIRKLRLSRMDVLKWMNSPTSLLHLDGFFLRLRLGKWEEGLGGTGYYVACITGEQRDKPPQGSKKPPISVNVGGIRCLVESQYISNQDFLEDELMAWWCATMKSGGKIPSEGHLRSKFDERKRLGF